MKSTASKEKLPKLTKKQKDFAKAYLETGVGNLSVKEAKYDVSTDESARAIASQNLTKPNVIAYLESKADRAAERIVELSEQEEVLPVALGASKDILDRAGYKPIERSQSVHIQVNLENRAKIEAITLKASEELLHDELSSNT